MNIAACEAVRAAEQATFRSGRFTSDALMDAVVERLWEACRREPDFPLSPAAVIVYAGKGNNAGDAVGLAARFGCPVVLRCVCPPGELSPETLRQLRQISPHLLSFDAPQPAENLLILDGLLGSGAVGGLRAPYADAVRELNALRVASPRSVTLAVDIPTGLNADTGVAESVAVQADVTAAIGCVKPGEVADGAEDYVGRLLCIPLPEIGELPPCDSAFVADADSVGRLPRRAYSCFKNRAGRVNIVAGSPGYTGAAQMCAEAALAAGAGLVALYCLPEVYPILAARVAAEVMVRPVASYAEVPAADGEVLLIGPGLGCLPADRAAAVEELLQRATGSVVLDADGLNMAAAGRWRISPHAILTPHPGEMKRLLSAYLPGFGGKSRREIVRAFLQIIPCTLLLKGARSVIADAEKTCYNSTGGSYMACGGQGDVLSGVIAALAAQGMPNFRAASLAAYVCGRAAAHAHRSRSFSPSVPPTEILRFLPAELA